MWRQIPVAIGLTLLTGTSVVVAFIIMIVGEVAAGGHRGRGRAPTGGATTIELLRSRS